MSDYFGLGQYGNIFGENTGVSSQTGGGQGDSDYTDDETQAAQAPANTDQGGQATNAATNAAAEAETGYLGVGDPTGLVAAGQDISTGAQTAGNTIGSAVASGANAVGGAIGNAIGGAVSSTLQTVGGWAEPFAVRGVFIVMGFVLVIIALLALTDHMLENATSGSGGGGRPHLPPLE